MIHFTLVVIIVHAGAAAPQAPVVQEEQPRSIASDPGLIEWRCPDCGWWNAYESMTAFKIGSRAHLRRCPKR